VTPGATELRVSICHEKLDGLFGVSLPSKKGAFAMVQALFARGFARRMSILSVAMAFLCLGRFAPVTGAQQHAEPKKVILDTDPGTDDALAMLLAFNSPELQVEAITVVAGNMTADAGLENALKIARLAARCDVPVAKGAIRPLLQELNTGKFWNGPNGLGGAELPPAKCTAAAEFAPDLIIQLVRKYPHQITLIPVGPLTNIAIAVAKDPGIVPLVKDVVLMGGGITGGNVTAVSEYNIHSDPEAASIVFNAGWPITMVGLDVTEITLVTDEDVARLESKPGPETTFAAAVARFQIGTYKGTGIFHGGAVHDALAVGQVIDGTILKTQDMRVDIETDGKFTRGMTVANRKNAIERNVPEGDHLQSMGLEAVQPNVHVAVSADSQKFVDMLIGRISGK
jgi:purine nucleosidase